MKNIKQNKKIFLIIILLVFLIGVFSLICAKIISKGKSENSELNYDDLLIKDEVYNQTSSLDVNEKKGNDDLGEKETSNNNANINNKEICIHISGEVKNCGVIRLKEGQRIIDAIEKAGGVTELADLDRVNLAFVLSDGQKVNIPNINNKDENNAYVTNDSGYNIIVDNGNNAKNGGGKVNINSASQTELETLEGIGPSTAAKIIEYREKNGAFNNIEDIKNISGIGDAKFDKIKDNVVVK